MWFDSFRFHYTLFWWGEMCVIFRIHKSHVYSSPSPLAFQAFDEKEYYSLICKEHFKRMRRHRSDNFHWQSISLMHMYASVVLAFIVCAREQSECECVFEKVTFLSRIPLFCSSVAGAGACACAFLRHCKAIWIYTQESRVYIARYTHAWGGYRNREHSSH